MLAVIVPVLKNFKGLAQLIHSLENTTYPHKVIVIDNWNVPDRSVASSWNLGIRKARHWYGLDHFLVCNDDVVLEHDFIHNATSMWRSIGPDTLFTGWNTRRGFNESDGVPKRERYGADYSCFFLTSELYDNVGEFDETFTPAYFEDNDYDYRVNLAGYESYSHGALKMYHAGSVTQNMDGPVCDSEQFKKNRDYYISKWGGEPGQETYKEAFNGEV